MIDTIDNAMQALATAEADVTADFGEDALDAGYSDIVAAVAIQYPPDVARELCRRTLGWVPADVRRFHRLPDDDDGEV